jgi:transposase-like protein
MCNEIRKYMGWVDGDAGLGGVGQTVEADKAFIGGKDKQGHDDKAVVLGMVEREGEVMTWVVGSRHKPQVAPYIAQFVKPGSRLVTDEAPVFKFHPASVSHETINHKRKEYVRGDVHTNTIEAFWSNLKRSIAGTYVSVSTKHLQTYLCEFEYRYNLRKQPHLMLDVLLRAFPKA